MKVPVLKIQIPGFRVQGLGFAVQGSGIRVTGCMVHSVKVQRKLDSSVFCHCVQMLGLRDFRVFPSLKF